jgi:hypothetical protein
MSNQPHQEVEMRGILLALLILATTPAWAKWVRVGESAKFVLYLDPATIRKTDDHRTVWNLHDLKKQDPDGERSIRLLHEYDCKAGRVRLLAASTHSGHMAKGKVLTQNDKPGSDWINLPKYSAHWNSFKYVCAR